MNKLLIGLLAGVGIGLLIAPAKGSETLKKITDGFDDFKRLVTDESQDLYGKAEDMAHTATSKTEQVAADWKNRI